MGGDCPAISISQNGSDVQVALNLLHHSKVCGSEPIEKLASGNVPIK